MVDKEKIVPREIYHHYLINDMTLVALGAILGTMLSIISFMLTGRC